jgi:hypothetical protein
MKKTKTEVRVKVNGNLSHLCLNIVEGNSSLKAVLQTQSVSRKKLFRQGHDRNPEKHHKSVVQDRPDSNDQRGPGRPATNPLKSMALDWLSDVEM